MNAILAATACLPVGVVARTIYIPDDTRRPVRVQPFHVNMPPFDVPFDIGQMAVQNGDRVEPLAKTAHRLRSQADFRDEP